MASKFSQTIPSELLRPQIEAYLAAKGISLEQLEELLGYQKSSITRRLYGGRFSWEMTDKIICKVGDPIAFWRDPEVIGMYYEGAEVPPDPAKPMKCAKETCGNWFEIDTEAGESGRMSRRRYCSTNCQNTDAGWKRGQHQPRHRRCRHGHDREKVGVYTYVRMGKTVQRCKACHVASLRKSRARQREAIAA